jgi:hypothetical protein
MKNTFRKAMSGIACPHHKRTKIILRKSDDTPYGFIKKHIAENCYACMLMTKDPNKTDINDVSKEEIMKNA